jgi:hypothetical protein
MAKVVLSKMFKTKQTEKSDTAKILTAEKAVGDEGGKMTEVELQQAQETQKVSLEIGVLWESVELYS